MPTGALIASNDNWQTTIIGGIIMQSQVQQIINSGHAPMDPGNPPSLQVSQLVTSPPSSVV